MWVRSLGQENPLDEEMATYSSILAWEIPRTEEAGRLQSTCCKRVIHDSASKKQLSLKEPQGRLSFCNYSLPFQPL